VNIFVLDEDPRRAAQQMCDKHVVKMPLESAQMLSTAVNVLHGRKVAPYKSAYLNHPCTVWARETLGNFLWLYEHGMELCREYSHRYGRQHKSQAVIEKCLLLAVSENIPEDHFSLMLDRQLTPHPLCMPEQYKVESVVESYRAYYIGEKMRFAEWKRNRPVWWPAQQE